jgi:tRNA pseudouridine55 synthase
MPRRIPLDELTIFSGEQLPSPACDFKKGAAFLMNKPLGWTSYQVAKLIRKYTGAKTGHTGTLDPRAKGLLIVCCGKATKSVQLFQELDKYYYAEVTFGASTPSYDADTRIDQHAPYNHIEEERISTAIEEYFRGDIVQYPPIYSAVKKHGKRLYEFARAGQEVNVYPRIVTIKHIELSEYDPPVAKLNVQCGRGTYIRSVAHDLGIKLNSRGYLSKLTRTAIGDFTNRMAMSINHLKKIFDPSNG